MRTPPNLKLAAIILTGLAGSVFAAEPALIFRAGDEVIADFHIADLQEVPGHGDFRLYDAMHDKRKHFAGVPLLALLKRAYGEILFDNEWSSIAFVAEDGYEAVAAFSTLIQQGAILVFEDLDTAGWETISGKGVDPGPYYLVWMNPQQLPKNGYPWPWQIKSISLLDFESTYPEIVPLGAARNSTVDRGYRLFRSRCMSCHSMNKQGGNIGPDLKAPRNISDYRSESYLKEFIRSSMSFGYSKMPQFADLSDSDLDDLVHYLQFMSSEDGNQGSSSLPGHDRP